MQKLIIQLLLIFVCLPSQAASGSTDNSPINRYRGWITQMKQAPRGPFDQVRWFCADGAVLPPAPYACKGHGGGVQHGRWSERTRILRDAGYYIGNLLISTDAKALTTTPEGKDQLKQLLLEHFLIGEDDGWIFRQARSYRGTIQAENEIIGANRILMALLDDPHPKNFLLAREAMRLLPRQGSPSLMDQVRGQSSNLAEVEPDFVPLRNKIHNAPSASDALQVEQFGTKLSDPDHRQFALALAGNIRRLHQPVDLAVLLAQVARRFAGHPLGAAINEARQRLLNEPSADHRLRRSSALVARLRHSMLLVDQPIRRYAMMRLSLALEREIFTAGTTLQEKPQTANRSQRLDWIEAGTQALYGTGLISLRQLNGLEQAIKRLQDPDINLLHYRQELQYIARSPEWARRRLEFHFGRAIMQLNRIAPLTHHFIPNRLRASPLLLFTQALDQLLKEADRLTGVSHRLLGQPVGFGLKALNPGLARGTLRRPPTQGEAWDPDGIYLLPATTQDLPPVAGILTLDAGNALSHIQLLAESLAIPNVVVDRTLLGRLLPAEGQTVVLSVTPGGQVAIDHDNPQWDRLFPAKTKNPTGKIEVDLKKLDLGYRQPISLANIRAQDAGRIAGPKAANLGELKHHFPDTVTHGLVIPFGVFRQLLEQPLVPAGPSAFEWLKMRYRQIEQQPSQDQRRALTQETLKQFRAWITQADPGKPFREQLQHALQQTFGPDGSYGVFVRSDTNVEDLPGFTGAGLNLTLPHVVGFDNILNAIGRVWASPFAERAFAWRQGRMGQPEQVYPSVLLLQSVAADKSGVLVTADLETGRKGWYSIAVNEGIGGAVQGQNAEELLISRTGRQSRLLAEATTPLRRILLEQGGLAKIPVSEAEQVLVPSEIQQLLAFTHNLPESFHFTDDTGATVPADIEFGFRQGKLVLFQIRPYLRNRKARQYQWLVKRDRGLQHAARQQAWPQRDTRE